MTLNDYQNRARAFDKYQSDDIPVCYALGLGGETGEVLEKIKKIYRDKDGYYDLDAKLAIAYELGDVLWYLSRLASNIDWDFDKIAELNLHKLQSRQERGTLSGSGDNR